MRTHLEVLILGLAIAIRVPGLQISYFDNGEIPLLVKEVRSIIGRLPPGFREEDRQSLKDMSPEGLRLVRLYRSGTMTNLLSPHEGA